MDEKMSDREKLIAIIAYVNGIFNTGSGYSVISQKAWDEFLKSLLNQAITEDACHSDANTFVNPLFATFHRFKHPYHY